MHIMVLKKIPSFGKQRNCNSYYRQQGGTNLSAEVNAAHNNWQLTVCGCLHALQSLVQLQLGEGGIQDRKMEALLWG